MDEVINIKDIYDRYEKDFAKPKQTLTYLDSILTSRFDFFTKCQTIVNTCLYLKDTNPEAIKPNLQYMQQLQERFEAEMNEKYDLYEFSYGFNPFDDLNKLATLFNNTREADEARLQAVHKALAAIDRLPDLLATVFIIYNNGFNIDQLVDAIASADAELEAGYHSMYFQKPGEKARYYLEDINPQVTTRHRKLCIMIHYYPRLVQKIENFLHYHLQSLKPIDTKELVEQTADASVKKSFSTFCRTLIKIIRDYLCNPDRFKKMADKLFKRGSKPTRDTKSRQCEKMWELSQTDHFENAYKLANAVILYSMREWNTAQYKNENLFFYTDPKKRRNVQSQLVVRFQSWCKHNGKDYPFVTE